MRGLVLMLIIYSLHDVVLSVNETVKDPSLLLRTYPKKVHSIQKFPQKLMNPARVFRSRKNEPVLVKKKANYEEILKHYTAFPKVATLDAFNAPDSPLFPLDFNIEQKPRVKKNLRAKRSVDDTSNVAKPLEAKPPVIKPTAAKPPPTRTVIKKPSAAKNGTSNVVALGTKLDNKKKPTVGKKLKVKREPKARPVKVKPRQVRKDAGKSKTKKLLRKKKINKKGKGRSLRNGTASIRKGKLLLRRKSLLQRNLTNTKSSQVRKASRRLIAARDAKAEDYPYMVSIQKDGEHWCAGALLNRRLIITTANCFWKSNSVSRLKVRVGSRQVDQGGQLTKIQEVMKHPLWSIRSGPDNDIALALLDRPVRFSHAVHGVDLPNRVMHPPFEDAWVTSFGSERRDGVYVQHGLTLQMYHVRLMSHEKCNNVTKRFGVAVSENFICLAQTGRRAPCTRDTGAPAVSDGILWGLASWGIRKLCGTERFPAMFSYVASHTNLDFVINATKLLMSDTRYYPMLDRFPGMYATSTPPSEESD